MNSETNSRRSLREMEQEVEAEGRKWMRQRLQKKLQAEADGLGLVFPPEWESGQASAQRNDAPRTAFGRIQLEVWRGRNPADGAWGIPKLPVVGTFSPPATIPGAGGQTGLLCHRHRCI